MNNIYNHQNRHNNQRGNHQNSNNNNNVHAGQSINNVSKDTAEVTVKKSLMRKISIAIILLVVVYGGYLSFRGQFAKISTKESVSEALNTKAESYIVLNELASKLNFKNSTIEKYSFELNAEKYNGYSIATVSYVGVDESPFNDELKNSGFTESENNLAEGKIAGLSVYSKDDLICIIKNDAVNPDSWGTNNPDYSSMQTFACADKKDNIK